MLLEFPVKVTEEMYISTVTNDEKEPVVVQSCRVFLKPSGTLLFKNESNKKIGDFYNSVRDLETEVMKCVSSNSDSWFDTHLSLDTIKDELFFSNIHMPEKFEDPFTMTVEISPSVEIYDKKKNVITDYEDKEVTLLLQLDKIKLTSTTIRMNFVVVQILVHSKKEEEEIKVEVPMIKEEREKVPLFSNRKIKEQVENKVIVEN